MSHVMIFVIAAVDDQHCMNRKQELQHSSQNCDMHEDLIRIAYQNDCFSLMYEIAT